MKRIYQVTGLIFIGIGIFFVVQGVRLRIEGQLGPGPGFFPFCIGIALTGLSLAWLVQVTVRGAPAMAADFLPPRPRLAMLGIVLAALVAFMLLLRPIGFNLAMLGLLLFLFFAIDRRYAVAKVAIAVLCSFGVHWLFEQVLRVPLPYAALPYLSQLGL